MADTKKRKKKDRESLFNDRMQIRIVILLIIFITIVATLKLGIVGEYFNHFIEYFFGNFTGIICGLILVYSLYYLFKLKSIKLTSPEIIGMVIVLLSTLTFASIPSDHSIKGMDVIHLFFIQTKVIRGGLIGAVLYGVFSMLFDYIGTIIACVLLLLVGMALLLGRYYIKHKNSISEFSKKQSSNIQKISKVQSIRQNKQAKIPIFPDKVFNDIEISTDNAVLEEQKSEEIFLFQQKQDSSNQKKDPLDVEVDYVDTSTCDTVNNKNYKLPSLSILNKSVAKKDNIKTKKHAQENATKLVEVLKQFNVNALVQSIFIGPSVTKYEITLEIGTRVNKILQLSDDIKMALAAKDIRIEAPIPGKSAVGIEIPNLESSMVTFKDVFKDIPTEYQNNKLLVPLGKDVTGQAIYSRLDKMPHLLIAGATGSGKSVCVNTIICSILMRAKPDEVKLLLVDPKKVELTNYNGIAHLLCPVVTDPKKAAVALRMIVEEMEQRYELFTKYNTRNIEGFNKLAVQKKSSSNEEDVLEPLPFIVVILDEVADLMMVASKDVEDCIMRISQMARAAGIHLIVATQRPSTDVITGVIKANIPSRIAFAVSSSIDSRTILDTSGAEKLLGKGDMLYSPMGSSHPIRVQGAFVSDEEVMNIVYHVKKQVTAQYEEKYSNLKVTSTHSNSVDEEDEEYENARQFVISAQKASTSLLQRQFRIGYNKAARIMDQLEADGVIGPQIGSKPREVLIRGYEEE